MLKPEYAAMQPAVAEPPDIGTRPAPHPDCFTRTCPREPLLRALLLLLFMLSLLTLPTAVLLLRTAHPPSTPAKRLLFLDADVCEPGLHGSPPRPVPLRGFNLMFKLGAEGMDRVLRQDRLLPQLLPGTTLLRLIMNHWDDDVTSGPDDCLDAAAEDFLNPLCTALFDEVLNWTSRELQGVWSIVTARSALAAGDGGGGGTVFDNTTLRLMWLDMWGAIARRYKSYDYIAGYEVMSEPRTFASADQVHLVQQAACDAIWAQDPGAACVVGAPRFYNRFNLNSTYLVTGGPALYAANFFAPRSWVLGSHAAYHPHLSPSLIPTVNSSLNFTLNPNLNLSFDPSPNPSLDPNLNPNVNPDLSPNPRPQTRGSSPATKSSSQVYSGASGNESSYGGLFACCDAYQKDMERRREVCGGVDAEACAHAPPVRVDRAWLEDQLRTVLKFREEFKVPCWIDQWGVMASAPGGADAIGAYLRDVLDVFESEGLHWTLWIWRRTFKFPDWTCEGQSVLCETSHGVYEINEELLSNLRQYLG